MASTGPGSVATQFKPAGGRTTVGDGLAAKLRAPANTARDTLLTIARRQKIVLPTLPGVQSLSIAARFIEGGRERFLQLIQMAALNEDADAIKWLMVFQELRPHEQGVVSWDDVCAASGVRPADLMAAVVSVGMEFGSDVADLVAASVKPTIVHQMGKSAKRIGGKHADIALKDRHAFLQAAKFLPVPRNMTIQVNANATANSQAAAAAASDPSMPSFLEDVTSAGAAHQEVQRQIADGEVAEDEQ